MSYLKLPAGVPAFSKAVFSLWFRVPKESVIAASSHSLPTDDENFFYMQGILPLITYGSIQQNANYQAVIDPDIIKTKPANSNPVLAGAVRWEAHTPYDIDPCLIGLQCYDEGKFDLVFNIQMGSKGSYDSLLWFVTRLDYVEGSSQGGVPGSGFVGSYKSTIVEGTHGIQDAQNEYFNVTTEIELQPDTWHHVLLSFDVGGSLSIGKKPSSTCKLWYAIDDHDYRGWQNLQPFRDEDDGLGENIILTHNVYQLSGFDGSGPVLFSNHYVPLPSGGFSDGMIPSNEGQLGLPAAPHYVDGIFRVQMAEFQMWTGVTLDTGVESNRRAFVDENGKPVDPTPTRRPQDDPDEPPKGPGERLLEKKPAVILHGSSNWKSGKNTGTLGIEINTEGEKTIIPSGQFIPVAKIEKFKPEPQLTETPTA